MDHRDFRILGLAASLRRASFHRGVVRAAHEVGPEWMSCESFDLSRIPYFNQDVEDQGNRQPEEHLHHTTALSVSRVFVRGAPSRKTCGPADVPMVLRVSTMSRAAPATSA